jgi:hypothetical protein
MLAWQSDDRVLVEARLAPGTAARVWADVACGAVPAGARLIRASGTYSVIFDPIEGSGKANVCMSSTDGSVKTYLPVVHK